MKALQIITVVFLLSVLSTGTVNANNPDPEKKVSSYTQMMIDEVRALVAFPQFAREMGLEGFVLVSFDYDALGRLHVLEANSNNVELKNYVITQLTQLDLCSHARKSGKVYNMRFDFRLI
mgnify:CR=1 FL=1